MERLLEALVPVKKNEIAPKKFEKLFSYKLN